MVTVVVAPEELRIPPNNLGTPVVAGCFGPAGVVVTAGEHGVRHLVAGFAADLTGALRAHRKHFDSKRTGTGPTAGWRSARSRCAAWPTIGGMPVTIESDYLLPYLVERRW